MHLGLLLFTENYTLIGHGVLYTVHSKMTHNDAILIGSRAMKFWYSDAREPNNDFDFLIDAAALDQWDLHYRHQCYQVHKIASDIIRFDLRIGGTLGFDSRTPSVAMFLEANRNMPELEMFGIKCHIASPETLLAIKRSHIHHRHNWYKHIADYTFLKSKHLTLSPVLVDALAERTKERDARGDFKRPRSLATSNDQFFAQSDAAVRRKFEHDQLHRTVMYHDAPLYSRAKIDQSKATLERGLFEKFDYADQCRLVREEAYVIGLERIIIPDWYNKYQMQQFGLFDSIQLDPKLAETAYAYALMRISTDLTSGWFRDFALENYHVLRHHDVDFVSKFLAAFESGALTFK